MAGEEVGVGEEVEAEDGVWRVLRMCTDGGAVGGVRTGRVEGD